MPPTLVFYISGHGFGHASRDVETIDAFRRRQPDARVHVRTAAPRWLFDLTLASEVEITAVECDTGVVQIDSLRLDADQTIARAAAFHATLDERASAESRVLRDQGATLVVGDIPPLAMAAAARAGVPAIALGNFTWDWIYSAYPDALEQAPDLPQVLQRAYRRATLALRLPMFGGFEVFGPRVRDVPFIARRSRFDRSHARRALGLPLDRPVVLLSFGGYGLASFDPAVLRGLTGYSFVMTADPQTPRRDDRSADHRAPAAFSRSEPALGEHVVIIDEQALYANSLRYEDVVAAADVVITKPGYGIVAECIANQTAMLYTSRGHFVEYDVITAAMPAYLRCRYIGHDDLFAGNWQTHLDRLLRQAPPPETPRTDGAEVVAGILADYV